jgi:hypothetical protein
MMKPTPGGLSAAEDVQAAALPVLDLRLDAIQAASTP